MTIIRATRPAADECSAYFSTYIAQVPDGDVVTTLDRGTQRTQSLLASLPEERGSFRYQPGKWSIKELIDHLSDTERVFAYRLLTFARGDAGPLPSFDENVFAPEAGSDAKSLAQVLAELGTVRASTIALLKGLPEAAWARRGVASGNPLSVRATAWIIAGHEIHHRKVLEERYLAAR